MIPQQQQVWTTLTNTENGTFDTPGLTESLAAAAAKINAQLQAKRGIQQVDVPPIRSVRSQANDGFLG